MFSPAGTEGTRADEPQRTLARPVFLGLWLALGALFAWNLTRTWFPSDDAFISFRYARHLADGLGPVWNAGERVEGYTNFAWVVLLAAGMRLGLDPVVLANVLGAASGALLLVALFRFTARGRSSSSPVPWLLVLVLVSNRSFVAWCTGGLETMLFALLVFLGFARVVTPPRAGQRDELLGALAFSAAALTRPEGVLFGALAGLVVALDVLRGQRAKRALPAFALPCVLLVGAHLLWRHAYYGAWLPNTFYAKVPGAWVAQGWRYLTYFHDTYRIGWFVPLALIALAGARRRTAAVFLGVLLVYVGYLLYVGGDLFELRFWVHVFPLLYVVLVEGLAALAGLGRGRGPDPRLLATLAAVALLVTTWLGFERVPGNEYGLQTVPGIAQYTHERMEQGLFLRAQIEAGRLPRELVLGLGGAGAVPYYTGWTTVDRRGLNDAYVAHLPLAERGFVGHERDAPYDYLVERHVAVFDFFNQLLVKPLALRQLRGPYSHDGHGLRMRAIPLGERALVFATFVDDAELAKLFPGVTLLELGG
jgi:hypothetical protein